MIKTDLIKKIHAACYFDGEHSVITIEKVSDIIMDNFEKEDLKIMKECLMCRKCGRGLKRQISVPPICICDIDTKSVVDINWAKFVKLKEEQYDKAE